MRILFLLLSRLNLALFHPIPHAIIPNTEPTYSLLNSVDFHPKEPLFCVTHTHNNLISLYRINNDTQPTLIQTIRAQLKEPQHAVFSPNGQTLIVANWTDLSLNIYLRKSDNLFANEPIYTASPPQTLTQSKPHGIAFSPSGKYLAMACGASSDCRNALALLDHQLKYIDILTHEQLPGIPKGICFSPDGKSLLVTFCDLCAIAIFHLDGEKIDPVPRQIIRGAHTLLSRPEDIKLSPDGTYCCVSNSDRDRVTFYHFDQSSNTIAPTPFSSLTNPNSKLTFPHGLAISSDGKYLAITQFGHIKMTREGNIIWGNRFSPREGTINLYRRDSF